MDLPWVRLWLFRNSNVLPVTNNYSPEGRELRSPLSFDISLEYLLILFVQKVRQHGHKTFEIFQSTLHPQQWRMVGDDGQSISLAYIVVERENR